MTLLLRTSLIGALCSALVSVAAGQGALTPPGAPAPTMKTLQQVEPRKPIDSLPFTIAQSGSYYLTQNLQFSATTGHAITVTASDVTIDLMGFTLSSTAGVTGEGIHLDATALRAFVKNGMIVGNTTVVVTGDPPTATWTITPGGFAYGVHGSGNMLRCENLHVANCRTTGIFAQPGSVVHCSAQQNGAFGIVADIAVDCYALKNGDIGLGSDVVQASRAEQNKTTGI